jgi:8-oxo-dGTP diphosphatase
MKTDWSTWQPRERANLCFVTRGDQILLIHKKRGLGAGKINGPGGRLEPGETATEAAIREVREELGVTPLDPQLRGELHFQFADGYSLHCSVFCADGCEGEPVETDEAIPLWVHRAEIPYDRMWADDRHWLPGLLDGRSFRGFFEFDGDRMLDHRLDWIAAEEILASS